MRLPALAWALALSCVLPARAAEETWFKVQSPHFTVLSNGGVREARDVALGFEQIHAVFAAIYPNLRTDASAETLVLAVKDKKTWATLLPQEKTAVDYLAGQFLKGWERDYVIVRLDVPEQDREVPYHEYVHKLLHLNFTRLPKWADEGLADFYGNTRFRKQETTIGIPNADRLKSLYTRTLMPLSTILSPGRESLSWTPGQVGLFYAESWALTHMLIVGEGMQNGARMSNYLSELQNRVDSRKAFTDSFGELDDIQKRFDQYIVRLLFPTLVLRQQLDINSAAFAGEPMSQAETEARLGTWYTRFGKPEGAKALLTAALAKDPDSALAHEGLGFLDFSQGKDDDSRAEFDRAASTDPKRYLSLYYAAMLANQGKTDADSLANLDDAMQRVLKANPLFAPALVTRSQVAIQQHRLQDAEDLAVRAQRLEPDRIGYLTHAAAILLLGNDYPDAVKYASAVAERASSSDAAEALAVLDQARKQGNIEATPDERTQEAEDMKYAQRTTAVEGVIKSMTCTKDKTTGRDTQDVVLQVGDGNRVFRSGKEFSWGFSDTLWYGEDHFNLCYHLEGVHAVVRYKPADNADASAPPEMRWLEIRDALIPSASRDNSAAAQK